jgi:predicted lipid-binding transport protein (Tim44 family)
LPLAEGVVKHLIDSCWLDAQSRSRVAVNYKIRRQAPVLLIGGEDILAMSRMGLVMAVLLFAAGFLQLEMFAEQECSYRRHHGHAADEEPHEFRIARAGGGTSSGSRGSRSFSSPSPSYSDTAPQKQTSQNPVEPASAPQPAGGGFMRGLAGGILGGLIGSMLFSSLGFAGQGGFGGSGIGLVEILLILGLGFFIYRLFKKKRGEEASSGAFSQTSYQPQGQSGYEPYRTASGRAGTTGNDGISYIRQMDASFSEDRFKDSVMDTFFKIQAAWMNRDLSSVSALLTDEMKRTFQGDIDKFLIDRTINRIENIAVRNVDITEAWQEAGQDFITVLFYANLLDYTTDESTGAVVTGSKTEPVKFEEYWTFTRPVGNNPWKLSAINQVEATQQG